jgi:hypothetical protein
MNIIVKSNHILINLPNNSYAKFIYAGLFNEWFYCAIQNGIFVSVFE